MPSDRLSLADVVAHPWMKNKFATDQEIKQEGVKRMRDLKLEEEIKKKTNPATTKDNKHK